MQFTCVAYFDAADDRSYELELGVCAPTFADAVRFVEERVAEKWPGTSLIEVDVQIPHKDFVQKMEKESSGEVGIVFEYEPAEQTRRRSVE